jgi:hypothetical protein
MMSKAEQSNWISTARSGFDVDDPVLPDWIDEEALKSGDYPYDKKLKEEDYDRAAGKAAGRTGQGAILAAGDRQAGDGAVRGPRCRRQGRRDLPPRRPT